MHYTVNHCFVVSGTLESSFLVISFIFFPSRYSLRAASTMLALDCPLDFAYSSRACQVELQSWLKLDLEILFHFMSLLSVGFPSATLMI